MKALLGSIGIVIELLVGIGLPAQQNQSANPARVEEIHDAAAVGDLNKVRALLEADPTLLESKDERDRNNLKDNTPLISACWGPPSNAPQAAVANFLIDRGANIHARNERGATPLYFALKDFDLTQRLIAMGAEVNLRAFGDFTPLHQAAVSGNLRVAKLLIDHGADPNTNGSAGTALQFMVRLSRPNEQMSRLLVESGAKLNQKFSLGNTELHLAVLKGSTDWTRILVTLGADINAVNDYGHTPLYYAAKHGYRQAADLLIASGANKSAIVETNYGKASQLNEKLKEGEAYLWYLGGTESPYAGYAVKTKEHLLIFNPTSIDDSPEAGLANGRLNPNELSGQNITALVLYPSYQGRSAHPTISELGNRLPGINVVLNFKPTADTEDSNHLLPYHLATPHEDFSVNGVRVHTIPAVRKLWFSKDGLSYLVEADGVKIFHAGSHAPSNEASELEKYRKEIDFLKPFGPIDIAILPVNGRHMGWIDYRSYLYLVDQLSPKAIYLIGDDLAKNEHRKCIDVLRARNVPVSYPEGGIAVGERFHYLRDQAEKSQSSGRASASSGKTGSQDQPQPYAATASYLELHGAALGEVTQHDAMLLDFHVPMLVDRLKKSGKAVPESVNDLLVAARAAYKKQDYYGSFRLYARAAGLAEDKVEQYEVAAALKLSLNRAIFASGESITLSVRPLFDLGHALASRYTIHTWLESRAGIIASTEQQRTITELRPTSFDFGTERLSDGVVAVGYRLDSGGDELVEFKHAVLIAKNSQMRLDGLKAKFATIRDKSASAQSPAGVSAFETLEYQLDALQKERSQFDGNWQRLAHPFGMYLSYLNFAVIGRPRAESPAFVGRVRYPEDTVFAETLVDALIAGNDPLLKQTGDMQQVYRATDGELVRYRVFVPKGYDPGRKYPLIVALHSGAGEGTYFEWETLQSVGGASQQNRLKQLAQEKGYIVACPNGRGDLSSARGSADVLAVLDRVKSLYPIDPNRVFLTGWSIGASNAWRISIAHPDRFNAIAPVAGSAEWLDRASAAKATALRIKFFAAGKDPNVAAARYTSVLAKELLPNFVYVEYPDTTHDAIWSKALPDIFDFFDTTAAGVGPTAPASVNFSGPSLGQTPPSATPQVLQALGWTGLAGDYLGQKPPGATPEVFALGIVSTDANEHSALSFSPDGNEVFWWANQWPDDRPHMSMTMRRESGRWSAPHVSPFGLMPAFSPDGRRVYFFAPRPGSGTAKDSQQTLDIWVADKQGDGWSEPKCLNLVARYPEIREAAMPRVTSNGTLYFIGYAADTKSNHGIYRAELINGEYAKPELLPRSINLPPFLNWAPFIAPDESYLLFSSNRTGSLDEYGDLYISRRQPDGSWTDPVALGEPVNSPMQEVFPGLSPDGKYLFFCRYTPGRKNDVYWVDAASIPALHPVNASTKEDPE